MDRNSPKKSTHGPEQRCSDVHWLNVEGEKENIKKVEVLFYKLIFKSVLTSLFSQRTPNPPLKLMPMFCQAACYYKSSLSSLFPDGEMRNSNSVILHCIERRPMPILSS